MDAAGVLAVALLDMVAASMVVTLLPTYLREDVGLSATAAGAVGSLYGVVQFFSSPFVGRAADRRGHRAVLCVCLLASAVAYALLGCGGASLAVVVCARLLAGLFKQTQNLCKSLVGGSASEAEKLSAFGRLNSMGNVAFMFSATLSGWMAVAWGMPSVFFATAFVFLLIYGLVLFSYSPSSDEQRPTVSGRGALDLLPAIHWHSQWDLVVVRLLQGCVVLLYRSSFNWLMAEKFGATAAVVGYLTSFQGAVAFASAFFVPSVIDALGGDRALVYGRCSVGLAVALVAMWFAPNLGAYVAALALLNACSAVLRVLSIDLTVERCGGRDVGAAVGAAASTVAVARAASPALGGLLHDVDRDLPTLVAAGLALLAALVVRRVSVPRQRSFGTPLKTQ